MSVILKLHPHMILPTLWLDRREWRYRFAKDHDEFLRLLDESAQTVLDDLGGFSRLVQHVSWHPREAPKTCTRCAQTKPVTDFYLAGRGHIRGECKDCTRRTTHDNAHPQP